jgi:hypothetical protein
MVLVDHIMAFIKDGTLIELTTDGLIKSGTALGIAMMLPVLLVWMVVSGAPKVMRRIA